MTRRGHTGASLGGTETSRARKRRDARRGRAEERAWEARSGVVTIRKDDDPVFDRLKALAAVCRDCAAMPGLRCEHCECQATEIGLLAESPAGGLDDAVHFHLCRSCTMLLGDDWGRSWVRGA